MRIFRGARGLPLTVACVTVALLIPAAAAADLSGSDLTTMKQLQATGLGQALGWSAKTNPCPTTGADWNGVTCDGNQVIYITGLCSGALASGQFPGTELAQLSGLTVLDLKNCYQQSQPVTGLASLGSLSQLGTLELSGNTGLSGTIADIFPNGVDASSTQLARIYLDHTGLSGPIPSWIADLPGTTPVFLEDAHFSGTLPARDPSAGPPDTNRTFFAQGNELSGTLPAWALADQGDINLDYNMLDVAGTPAGNIDKADPNWRLTQTVPPANVQVSSNSVGTATLSWTPIAYQANGGGYEVLVSQSPAGPYTQVGSTIGAGGKAATGITLSGLPAGTDYFVVRTNTPANVDNPNDLTSVGSAPVSATVPGPPSTQSSGTGTTPTPTTTPPTTALPTTALPTTALPTTAVSGSGHRRPPRRCVVPRLRGVTLARAAHLLRAAGCRLGRVHLVTTRATRRRDRRRRFTRRQLRHQRVLRSAPGRRHVLRHGHRVAVWIVRP